MNTKFVLALCLTVATSLFSPAWAAGESSFTTVSGEVQETQDAGNYTYLRIKTAEGEVWAAVTKAPVQKGAKVTVANAMLMSNFESKALKKTFTTILFGSLAGANQGDVGAKAAVDAHAAAGVKAEAPAPVKVPKASGPNAYTVAEITGTAAALKDKPILVSGQVIKYNGGVMGKNWIHLQDGSGAAANGTHDILLTTLDEAKPGDIVTVSGVVRTDKDFGSGYTYKVLIEDAALKR